jgi:hypothetical protein
MHAHQHLIVRHGPLHRGLRDSHDDRPARTQLVHQIIGRALHHERFETQCSRMIAQLLRRDTLIRRRAEERVAFQIRPVALDHHGECRRAAVVLAVLPHQRHVTHREPSALAIQSRGMQSARASQVRTARG